MDILVKLNHLNCQHFPLNTFKLPSYPVHLPWNHLSRQTFITRCFILLCVASGLTPPWWMVRLWQIAWPGCSNKVLSEIMYLKFFKSTRKMWLQKNYSKWPVKREKSVFCDNFSKVQSVQVISSSYFNIKLNTSNRSN